MTASLPLNLLVAGRRCVVMGERAVADGKVEALESRGADVTVIVADPSPELESLAAVGRVRLERRVYDAGDCDGAFLVVAGHDDRALDEAVFAEAVARGILVNVVDDPAHCTAIFPAIVRRGALQISVSTDGSSPAVAVRAKERLESEFGAEYGVLVDILGEARPTLAGWRTMAQRSQVWYSIVDSPDVWELIRTGDVEGARRFVRSRIDAVRAT